MERKGILVVGSANMDLVVSTRRFPLPGETVFSGSFGMFPGGKGANQAVAAARLGGRVQFVGRLGKDVFGQGLLRALRRDRVAVDGLTVDRSAATGVGLITLDGGGQNTIVVASGSNMKLAQADIERHRRLFVHASVLLVQLEIPLATVVKAVSVARQLNVTVVLNPAPGRKLPNSLLRRVDYLTPNETELRLLTGLSSSSIQSVERAARRLIAEGVGNVLVTLGSRGCLLVREDRVKLFPARKVKAVDTTAAGDAFNGALALSLAKGQALDDAIGFANAVAAFSVTRMGAQASLPTWDEIESFLR